MHVYALLILHAYIGQEFGLPGLCGPGYAFYSIVWIVEENWDERMYTP